MSGNREPDQRPPAKQEEQKLEEPLAPDSMSFAEIQLSVVEQPLQDDPHAAPSVSLEKSLHYEKFDWDSE